MAEDKKYYWLKLKKDFFKRHDIQIIESMDNGKDYILFYLKMLVESVDHEGHLRFNDTIPYNEKMLSTITNTNIDIVRSAMKVFTELNMMEILEDKTIYMNEVEKMLGTETYWAEQKRKQREKQKKEIGQCPNNVLLESKVSKQEIDIDIDIDKELELDKKNSNDDFNIFKYLELRGFVGLSALVIQQIQSDIEMYSIEEVKKAIDIADNNGVHNYSYVKATLEKRRSKGEDKKPKEVKQSSKIYDDFNFDY